MRTGTAYEHRINLLQGEYRVSSDPEVVLTTILGSCVAACIRDATAGVGGMNHFLLPGENAESRGPGAERYGVYLMELLVNGLMKAGAQRDRLEAKLFGGARMMQNLSDVGKENAEFAQRYLKYEGIHLVSQDLLGVRGRRLQYWPVSGRARQSYVVSGDALDNRPVDQIAAQRSFGEVELF